MLKLAYYCNVGCRWRLQAAQFGDSCGHALMCLGTRTTAGRLQAVGELLLCGSVRLPDIQPTWCPVLLRPSFPRPPLTGLVEGRCTCRGFKIDKAAG